MCLFALLLPILYPHPSFIFQLTTALPPTLTLLPALLTLFSLCGQFAMAEATCDSLSLDGLVVIGGDDSNTNACLLAEYFR